MRSITLVYAYYDNPGMLARQYREWATYPAWERSRVRVVVVDDASPLWPAFDVPRLGMLPNLQILRVLKDVPWHQDGARNLGAHVAEDGWLFLSDIDHVLPLASLQAMFRKVGDTKAFYTFDRLTASPDCDEWLPMLDGNGNPKPHPNSYAMTRELYWKAGGYDEDFCGVYGTDGAFRKQLLQVGYHRHLAGVPIVRYPREVIPDASTTTIDRKLYGGDHAKAEARRRKKAAGRTGQITTLDFEWEQQL